MWQGDCCKAKGWEAATGVVGYLSQRKQMCGWPTGVSFTSQHSPGLRVPACSTSTWHLLMVTPLWPVLLLQLTEAISTGEREREMTSCENNWKKTHGKIVNISNTICSSFWEITKADLDQFQKHAVLVHCYVKHPTLLNFLMYQRQSSK